MTMARRHLRETGIYLMAPAELNACLGVDAAAWHLFGAHWDELVPDPYAAELGTQRLRRYGHYVYSSADRTAEPMPLCAFVQPDDSNPLYVDRERQFLGLTESFMSDPMLRGLLVLLGELAVELDPCDEWHAQVTPFRVVATATEGGNPTPEGLHRDGVTLVSSLLINRHNAIGGTSTVCDREGSCLMETTMHEPGTLLLGDDRRTLHGVSPIRPRDPDEPAWRDVLVLTFAPSSPSDRRQRR
ncbi:MAG: 2OG-Fe dioxygenase family protein [Mycobacteriaceae bacterium]|nr:2OG-Fe dioxygenase family protein [Mycobacteriaceae bacterium]